jgi:hypothetical protein
MTNSTISNAGLLLFVAALAVAIGVAIGGLILAALLLGRLSHLVS